MNDIETKYAAERARNLSRELTLRDHNELAGSDVELCVKALDSYGDAILANRLSRELGDLERRIIGYHALDSGRALNGVNSLMVGPTDSEVYARALKFYSRVLASKMRTMLPEAA